MCPTPLTRLFRSPSRSPVSGRAGTPLTRAPSTGTPARLPRSWVRPSIGAVRPLTAGPTAGSSVSERFSVTLPTPLSRAPVAEPTAGSRPVSGWVFDVPEGAVPCPSVDRMLATGPRCGDAALAKAGPAAKVPRKHAEATPPRTIRHLYTITPFRHWVWKLRFWDCDGAEMPLPD